MQYVQSGFLLSWLWLSLFLSIPPAHTQEISTAEWIKASSIATVGIGSAIGLIVVPTPECSWCQSNQFDEAIGRALLWRNLESARMASDLLAFGVAPVMALGGVALSATNNAQFGRDALVLLDTIAATAALTELAKVASRRARPEIAFGLTSSSDSQANRSFWSGHTALTFAMLTSSSVMAFRNNYAWAPLFTGFSASLALMVAYSRLAAGKHWMTDVLTGMVVGCGVGALMPFVVQDSKPARVASSSRPLAMMVGFSW